MPPNFMLQRKHWGRSILKSYFIYAPRLAFAHMWPVCKLQPSSPEAPHVKHVCSYLALIIRLHSSQIFLCTTLISDFPFLLIHILYHKCTNSTTVDNVPQSKYQDTCGDYSDDCLCVSRHDGLVPLQLP